MPTLPSGSQVSRFSRLAYLLLLGLATLTPQPFQFAGVDLSQELARAFHPSYSPRDAVDAARNLALFAGWGAMWVVTCHERERFRLLAIPVLTGALLSVSIELLQLGLPSRNTNVLDVVTNTGGALLGAFLVVGFERRLQVRRAGKSFVGVPALVFAASYAGATLTEAVFPFGSTPLPGVYGGPTARFGAALEAFEPSSLFQLPLFESLLFVPLGLFGVAALVEAEWSYGRATRAVSLGGLIAMGAAEVGHGMLAYPIVPGAWIAHSAAIGLGALLGSRWIPRWSRRLRGRMRPLWLSAGYVVLLALWAWRPFGLETSVAALQDKLSLARLIPLHAHSWRVELFSVADIVAAFFLYVPVGSLLAAWPLRFRGVLAHLLPGLYVAMGTELGQIFVTGRYPDGTDLLVQCAGVAIGWAVLRHAGFRPYGQMLVGRS